MRYLTIALVSGITLASASQDVDTSNGYLNFTRAWDISDCVASHAFDTCLKASDTSYQNSTSNCPTDGDLDIGNGTTVDCLDWYECKSLADQLNCAMSFCWNRVYSCDYQRVATDMLEFCYVGGDEDDENTDEDLAATFSGIPYYPAPDDAPGGCSCNLGNMLMVLSEGLGNVESCSGSGDDDDNDGDVTFSQSCSCCAYSGTMSRYYDTCPTTDPKDVGIDVLLSEILGSNFTFSSCDSSLASTDCSSSLNITSPNNTTLSFPNSATLASAAVSATGVLSDLAGQVTSPASGYTLTWTANSTPYTITATSTAVPSLSSTAKTSGTTATASGSKGASSTASGSASASTTGNAGARVEVGGLVVLGAMAVLAQL